MRTKRLSRFFIFWEMQRKKIILQCSLKWVIYRKKKIRKNLSVRIEHWPIRQWEYVYEKSVFYESFELCSLYRAVEFTKRNDFFQNFHLLNHQIKINWISARSIKFLNENIRQTYQSDSSFWRVNTRNKNFHY